MASTLRPRYLAIQDRILEGSHVNGDETSWPVMGLSYWVWCIVGTDAVWFSIQGEGLRRGQEHAARI